MKKLLMATSLLALAACSQEPAVEEDIDTKANRIAQENIIVDGHIDVPYRLNDEWDDVGAATAGGNFDYPRAVAGGLNAPFMSIYTPSFMDGTPNAKSFANASIAIVERLVTEHSDKFMIATSVAEVRKAFADGLIALPLGMENGSPILNDLANLDYFYERGVRYITLTHGKSNQISDSSYDDNKRWDGLSEFGVEVVKRMNELGIIVDISHVSDGAFWDVIAMTDVPVMASHSSARKFTPGFERNMNDDMIKALVKNGGVIMINYGSSFVTEAANKYRGIMADAYRAWLAEKGEEASPENRAVFAEEYAKTTPYPFATTDEVLDHFDHVVKIAGIDHVGIGSDYDGVGDSLPIGLKDVSTYPHLVKGLLERGYSEEDVIKVLGENALRVWEAVEAAAAK